MARRKQSQHKSGCLSAIGLFFIIFVVIAIVTPSKKADDASPSQTAEIRASAANTPLETPSATISTEKKYSWNEDQIIACLSNIDGIVDVEAVTAERDPNGELNKPGGYIFAAFFSYDKVDQQQFPEGNDAIDNGTLGGGCIELFPSNSDAEARANYFSLFSPEIAGHQQVIDAVVIRTSGKLSLEQSEVLINLIVAEFNEKALIVQQQAEQSKRGTIEVKQNSAETVSPKQTSTEEEKVTQKSAEKTHNSAGSKVAGLFATILFVIGIIGLVQQEIKRKKKKEAQKIVQEQIFQSQANELKEAVYRTEKIADKAIAIDLFISSWDEMIKTLDLLKGYQGSSAYNEINPDVYIQQKQYDFQWKLRNAIERHKEKSIKLIRTDYKNSKEHRALEYQDFCESIIDISDRLSDETKEFADNAANEIYRAAELPIPHIDLFPDGYFVYGETCLSSLSSSSHNLTTSIKEVDGMDGHQFEYWCADLLRKNGFINVSVTQGSGDQGIDVLAEKGGIRYAIQCKCYSGKLGNSPIQEAHTGKDFYHCHVGVVMTNSYFTPGAIEAAARTNIVLWDRDKLAEFLKTASEK